jgi:flagellar protein FliO/FliZ
MSTTPDMLTASLKMIASLGMVLALILGLLYGIKKVTRQRAGDAGGKQIRVLESHYMGVKKTISLVSVPGKVLVVGVSGDRINLLDTLDEDLVRPRMAADETNAFGALLSDGLKKFSDGFKGRDDR